MLAMQTRRHSPEEGDKRAFLFAIKGGAYGKSPVHAIFLDVHLLALW